MLLNKLMKHLLHILDYLIITFVTINWGRFNLHTKHFNTHSDKPQTIRGIYRQLHTKWHI